MHYMEWAGLNPFKMNKLPWWKRKKKQRAENKPKEDTTEVTEITVQVENSETPTVSEEFQTEVTTPVPVETQIQDPMEVLPGPEKIELPARATVTDESANLLQQDPLAGEEPGTAGTKLRFHDNVLLIREHGSDWYYAYDSASKKYGYVLKSSIQVEEHHQQMDISEADLERWKKMTGQAIAKERGIDWNETLRLFHYTSRDTEGVRLGTLSYIKQQLIEGWTPADGTPEVKFWHENGMLIIEAWKPGLARKKALELGLVPDTGKVYQWYRSYYSKEKNAATPHNVFELRDKPTQIELDYLKATQGLTPFEGSIYDFAKEYGTYAKFVDARGVNKLATFKPYKAVGIAFDPGENGGVIMRSTPYGEGETELQQDNKVAYFPFNTKFDITQISEEHGWYYATTQDQKYSGYIAKHLIKTDLPEPTAFLHEVLPGQGLLEIVAMYYSGADFRDYVNMLVEFNKGPGIYNLESGKRESWDGAQTRYGFLVWIPGKLYAYKHVLSKQDKFSDNEELEELSTEQKEIDKQQRPVTQAEISDWNRVRDIVFKLDKSLIEEFNDLTGFSWSDFFQLSFGGVPGFISVFLGKSAAARELDNKLKKLGYSIIDLFLALSYFTHFTLKKTFDLLDQSALLIQSEKQKYTDAGSKDFKDLLTVLRSMNALYDEADLLRAKAIKRFFQKENTDKEPEWTWTDGQIVMESGSVQQFRDLKSAASDEAKIAAIIKQQFPGTAEGLLTAYMADYSDLPKGTAREYIKTNYKEFEQANKKETQANELRQEKGKTENMPVLFINNDMPGLWKQVSRMERDEDIRQEVIKMLNKKASNVVSTRSSLANDKNLVWELAPVINMVKQQENIAPESNLDMLVNDLTVDQERASTFRSIALAALGIVLGILGFFTAGSTWAFYGVLTAGVAVSGYDLYLELKQYMFQDAARDTGIGPIMAVSDKEPSLVGVVFAILGLVLDVVALGKHALKVAGLIDNLAGKTGTEATEQLGKLYDELAELKQIPKGMDKEAFIKQMQETLKRDQQLFNKHKEAVEELLANVAKSGGGEVATHVRYAIAHLYDLDPNVAKALVKANDGPIVLLRVAVDVAVRPGVAEQYITVARVFMKEGNELTEEGMKVMRYISESAPGTLNEMMPVVKALEDAGVVDRKFMSEVLTDGKLRKLITENPADASKIKGLWDDYAKSGSKENFGKYVEEVLSGIKVRTIDFIPSSGSKLVGNPYRTTTILGRWNPDMKQIKDYLDQSDFNVGTALGKNAENKGGFNFLDVPSDLEKEAGSKFFEIFNRPWLDEALRRGDDIVLATRPVNKFDYIDEFGNLKGNFAKELQYLVLNNYKPKNLSPDEWKTVLSWFE